MCPVCGNKTRLKIREDTELKKFPLYCPKCRQENLIEIKQFKVTVITEPDAKTGSAIKKCRQSNGTTWSYVFVHNSKVKMMEEWLEKD